jgi:hypothetical protein
MLREFDVRLSALEMEVATYPAEDTFQHQPLDHENSTIRFIKILPGLSPDGLIECTITNTTVDATYVYLSYRWGLATSDQQILLNDRSFRVRQNLFDFLDMRRAKTDLMPLYWIDAMCIDQSNTAERYWAV